jgi:hypothetical protein
VETYSLSCPFCNTSFNATGRMPMEITSPRCRYIQIIHNTIIDTEDFCRINNICNTCNLTIHPNFVGYHKCGYGNCPVCKIAVTNSEYWYHIKSHPRHENDGPTRPTTPSNFGNMRENKYRTSNRSE